MNQQKIGMIQNKYQIKRATIKEAKKTIFF